ncbi:MAG: PfkB family carbohydrate kinase [Thaumarchaeota archaeon]|nr:PfkB family carbohydrate kinase [Nitrososphaerota archaeon]
MKFRTTGSASNIDLCKRNIILAGHLSIDEIIDRGDPANPRVSLGGGVAYGSIALSSLGYKTRIVSKIGWDFPAEFGRFLSRVACDPNALKAKDAKTTSYMIDQSSEPRKLWLKSKCIPLSISDFPKVLGSDNIPDTLVLNPVAGEISPALVMRLIGANYLALDSQGFVRRTSKKDLLVRMRKIPDITFLKGVDLLKADAEELRAWTGKSDYCDSVSIVSKYVKKLLVTSGPGAVELYEKDRLRIRAYPFETRVRDTTGAGDILLACFAARRLETGNDADALAFAISAATLAVRHVGIRKAYLSHSDVLKSSRNVRIQC